LTLIFDLSTLSTLHSPNVDDSDYIMLLFWWRCV